MGLGQGSRGASHGWMQLSSVIVNIMKKTGHAADIRHPITGAIVRSVGSLFVDDANIFVYGDRRRYKSAGALYVKVKATAKACALLFEGYGRSIEANQVLLVDDRLRVYQWEI